MSDARARVVRLSEVVLRHELSAFLGEEARLFGGARAVVLSAAARLLAR